MIVSLARTLILFVAVMIGLRIMGKRQIADMQANELVVTILVSQIATIPIQDINQPVLNGIISIFLLVIIEVVLSFVSLKWSAARVAINGSPVVIISDGVLDQKALKKLRITVDDVLENLRQNNVFDITEVQFALVETSGKISVLLKPDDRPATAGQVGAASQDGGFPVPVIYDGALQRNFMDVMGVSQYQVNSLLSDRKLELKNVLIMTVDSTGKAVIIEKEDAV